jgi:hypothetical protein
MAGQLTRRVPCATEEELIFGTETCRLMASWSHTDDDNL